jgi:arsenite methyltransferase
VLDVGCGRGLMLVGAARRLTTGRAVGIDIWQAADQSANTADGTLQNAAAEGVSDRVSVQTADMRVLPFGDGSFDVILSHWAVHNVANAADRAQALAEMVRVLRQDGVILLADIEKRAEYLAAFQAMGLRDVRVVLHGPLPDALMRAVSFGSFGPATVFARKA